MMYCPLPLKVLHSAELGCYNVLLELPINDVKMHILERSVACRRLQFLACSSQASQAVVLCSTKFN